MPKSAEGSARELAALRRVLILLEDSEPWARNYLRQSPAVRKVDLDRMAASIVDALAVVRPLIK